MAATVADLAAQIEAAFGEQGVGLFNEELLQAAHAASPKNFSGLKAVAETWSRRLTLAAAEESDLQVVTALRMNAVANENPDLGDKPTPATGAFTSTEADTDETDEDEELKALLAEDEAAKSK